MKRSILFFVVVGVIAGASGLWISQNLQRKDAKSPDSAVVATQTGQWHLEGGKDFISLGSTPTPAPAMGLWSYNAEKESRVASGAKELQNAIERENNPQLRDGVPETGAGLKRMKKFASVEVSPKLLASWNCGAWTKNATFSRDDKWLLLGSSPTEIYRTSNWSMVRTLRGRSSADFSPNSRLVAASNAAPQKNALSENAPGVGIWRRSDGKQLRLLNDKSGLISAVGVWGPVAFSPDGNRLLTLGEAPHTKWRPYQGNPGEFNSEARTYRQIALKVWDVSSGKRLKVIPGPSWGAITDVSVSWVRTSVNENGKFEPRYFGEGDGICQLPNRTLGVQINEQHYLSIEDLTAKQLIRNIPFGDQITAAALSSNGALVASGGAGQNVGSKSQRGMIKIWRVADGKLLAKFEGKGGSTRAIAFSRDGKKLVVVGRLNSGSGGIVAVYAL